MAMLRNPSERNSAGSRWYHAALVPSAADTRALSSLTSTHQDASWYGRAICGRRLAPFRGGRSWRAVPAAAFVSRLSLLVGVVLRFSASGALLRGGGKLSMSATSSPSV